MATIADLIVKISANTMGAEKDMQSFGSKAQSTFGKALLPAVGILGAVGFAAKKTTDAATALGESQNAVNVVFGDAAKKIHAFAKVAGPEAGLSMRSLNELVTPIGASLINMGDSADVAATKSVALARRAADMASVFNVDVKDALGAIQAGLRGEADPLERFGVGLSDAAVKAKAMSMGLAKTTAALTAGDKAQARYALLMDQTNKLQGDFKNTSDGAANAARINAAAQENLSASIGKGLLPAVTAYQTVIRSVTGFMAGHTTAVKIGALAIGALAAAVILVNVGFMLHGVALKAVSLATKAYAAAVWLLNFAMAVNPFVLVAVAVLALAAAIVIAWNRSETFRRIVISSWNAVRDATVNVFNSVKSIISSAINFIIAVASKHPLALLIIHFGDVRAKVAAAMNAVRSAVSSAMSAVSSAVGAVVGVFDGAVSAVMRLINAIRSIPTPKIPGAGLLKHLPGFAGGVRNFGGGLAVVGERGPELVGLPRGSSVFSNSDSRDMLGGDSGGWNGPLIGEVHVHDNTDVEVLARRVQRVLAFNS